jgi:peptidoglycan/xylan/chitin deacetylase (PgdA/CDA1 family)
MENNRYRYWPEVKRPPLRWPNNAQIALWVIPNIEHFPFDKPSSPGPGGPRIFPDVQSFAQRDYGNRVGVWRLMEVLDRYGIRATVALNSDICRYEPDVIEGGVSRRWEWMGHGKTNSERLQGLEEAREREVIHDILRTIAESTGASVKGWLSPGLVETLNTPDVLAEEGVQYLSDWTADDQPFPMRVTNGRMITMPYGRVNDVPSFERNGWTGEQFCQMICDQFDVLYREGERSGKVMAISLHPYLIGAPFRIKWLDKALEHIAGHEHVWLTTGGEIADWYYGHYYDQALEQAPFPSAR